MSQPLPVSINSSIPRPDERKARGDQETTDAPFEEEDNPLDNGRYERMATKAAMAARLAALEEEHAATRRENAALKLALGSRPAAFEPSLTSSAAGTVTRPRSLSSRRRGRSRSPLRRSLSQTGAAITTWAACRAPHGWVRRCRTNDSGPAANDRADNLHERRCRCCCGSQAAGA